MSLPSPRGSGVRATAGVVFFAAYLAAMSASVIPRLSFGVARLLDPWTHLNETWIRTLARQRGGEYAAAIASIARALPPDATYGLVDAVDLRDGGGYWIRFDLAPRKAIYLGTLEDLRRDPRPAELLVAEGRKLVLARPGPEPSELWGANELARALEATDAR